jgi:hypothetical protein
LQAAAGDGLQQLQWRCPEDQSTRSHDEEILAQLVEEQGAQGVSPTRQLEPPAESSGRAAGGQAGNRILGEPASARGNSRLFIGGALLAAAVAGGVIFYFAHGKTAPSPAADQTPAVAENLSGTTPPSPGAPASAARAAHPGTAEHSEAPQAAITPKPAKNEVKPPAEQPALEKPPERERPTPKPAEPPAAKVVSGGRCDLEPSQFSGQIAQAEKNLGRGKYDAAKREFAAVLACDSGNARAREGMERARMAAAEADGSQ